VTDNDNEPKSPRPSTLGHLDYEAGQIAVFVRAAQSYVRLGREVPPWLMENIARLKAESSRRLLEAAPDEATPRSSHENISYLDQLRRRRQRGV
jgi:hypothetical protein